MATSNVTVHVIVKNEDQWIWYAIASVIDHVDRLIIYDTGSTDKTMDIIKSFDSKKIYFEEKGNVTPSKLTQLRNDQIEQTKTEWFMLVDGDEVWPQSSIQALTDASKKVSSKVVGIVVKALLPVGDLDHLQDEQAGKYNLLGMKGHFNIRLYRKKDGYSWKNDYPLEAYADSNGVSINEKNESLYFEKYAPYFHMRLLGRSSLSMKKKLEIGSTHIMKLPEVLSTDHPKIVPSAFVKFSTTEYIQAMLLSPLLKVKRLLR